MKSKYYRLVFLFLILLIGVIHMQFDCKAEEIKYIESAEIRELEITLSELVNQYRKDHGLDQLTASEDIAGLAANWAMQMCVEKEFKHNPQFNLILNDYILAGENLAKIKFKSKKTADELARKIFEGWLRSPSHKANIVDSDYNFSGIAAVAEFDGEYYTVYVCQNFMQKAVNKPNAATEMKWKRQLE